MVYLFDLVALSPINWNNFHEPTVNWSPDSGLHEIMARGWPWRVVQADVRAFFANVNIIGAIKIQKNGAMEAIFYVCSKDEVRKAMANDKKQHDFHVIYGEPKLFCLSCTSIYLS